MMNWIFVISSLYVFRSIFISDDILGGLDERYNLFPNKNIDIPLEKILQIYETKNMLNFLECNNTNKLDKLYKLEKKCEPSIYNAFSGGLFDDWNFDFDSLPKQIIY